MTPRKKIFIGGIERSGTTFLGVAFARSVSATVIPEINFKHEVSQNVDGLPRVFDNLKNNFRFQLWERSESSIAAFAPMCSSIYEAMIASIEDALCGRSHQHAIIDHTPENFKNASFLDAAYSPELYVYLVRDPRSVIYSIMRTDWGYPSVGSAVAFWQRRYEEDLEGFAYLSKHAPERLAIVRYEELCADPERVVADVVRQRSFAANAQGQSVMIIPKYTTGQHGRVMAKARNIVSWKSALNSREVRYIEDATKHAFFSGNYFPDVQARDADLGLSDRIRMIAKPLHRVRAHLRRRKTGLIAEAI